MESCYGRGAAEKAAAVCFDAWVNKRGTTGSSELEDGIAQVRLFIEQHGSSRFASTEEAVHVDKTGDEERHARDERTINRAGFRKKRDSGGWDFLVLPEVWRKEVCKGFDAGAIAREMVKRGLMVPSSDGESTKPEWVPVLGEKKRFYRITSAIFGDGS